MPLPFSVSQPPRAAAQPPRAIASGAVGALAVLQLCLGVSLLALYEAYKVYFFTQFAPQWYRAQAASREASIWHLQQQRNATMAAGGGGGGGSGTSGPEPYAELPPGVDFGPLPSPPGDPHDWHSPMTIVFYLALVSNVFAIAGVAGVLHSFTALIVAFFAYSAFATVALAHVFVDMLVESRIDYSAVFGGGGRGGPSPEVAGPPPPVLPPGFSGYEKAAAALVFVQLLASAAATALSLRAAEEVRRRRQYKHMGDLAPNLAFEPDAP